MLEVKDKDEEKKKIEIKLPEKVISNPMMDDQEEELLNFIAKNWTKKSKGRKRLKLKKKHSQI